MSDPREIRLPPSGESAARARLFIRETVKLDSMRHSETDLLVTELVANALMHAPDAPEIVVAAEKRVDRGFVVTVAHEFPQPIEPQSTGVGFMLLERVAKKWGHSHDGSMLTVWFEVRTPGSVAIPTELTDAELIELMPADPAAYSDELVRRHSSLARSMAARYRGKGIDEEDLLQVANFALLKAIQRYDPATGSLRPYAAATISGELKRLLRDKGWSVRVPRSLQESVLEVGNAAQELEQILERKPEPEEIGAHLDISVEEVLQALDAQKAYTTASVNQPMESTGTTLLDTLETYDAQLLTADDRLMLAEAIADLPDRQKELLRLRFDEDLTQAEIAARVGLSQMHVSRLLTAAYSSIRESVAG